MAHDIGAELTRTLLYALVFAIRRLPTAVYYGDQTISAHRAVLEVIWDIEDGRS